MTDIVSVKQTYLRSLTVVLSVLSITVLALVSVGIYHSLSIAKKSHREFVSDEMDVLSEKIDQLGSDIDSAKGEILSSHRELKESFGDLSDISSLDIAELGPAESRDILKRVRALARLIRDSESSLLLSLDGLSDKADNLLKRTEVLEESLDEDPERSSRRFQNIDAKLGDLKSMISDNSCEVLSGEVGISKLLSEIRNDQKKNQKTFGEMREGIAKTARVFQSVPSGLTEVYRIDFFDRDQLTDHSRYILSLIADREDSSNLDIRIFGYADRVGTEEYNKSLGWRRVSAVKEYLINRGIPEGNIIDENSFGEGRPIFDSHDEERDYQNRVVLLSVTRT